MLIEHASNGSAGDQPDAMRGMTDALRYRRLTATPRVSVRVREKLESLLFCWKVIRGSVRRFVLQQTSIVYCGVILFLPLYAVAGASIAEGQTTASYVSRALSNDNDLPDAPSASLPAQPMPQSTAPSVPSQYGGPMQPMSIGGKAKYFLEPVAGPRAFFTNAGMAGIRIAAPPDHYPHEWRAGAGAFGRNYGDSFAKTGAQAVGQLSASVLLHEDPRYRRSESANVPSRFGHAIVFTFIDRTDGGHRTIAMSNFVAATSNGFIGNAYLPSGFADFTHAGQRSEIAFGGLAAQNLIAEFYPEIGRALYKLHLNHVPFPPVSYTGSWRQISYESSLPFQSGLVADTMVNRESNASSVECADPDVSSLGSTQAVWSSPDKCRPNTRRNGCEFARFVPASTCDLGTRLFTEVFGGCEDLEQDAHSIRASGRAAGRLRHHSAFPRPPFTARRRCPVDP